MRPNPPQRRASAALSDPGTSKLVFQAANRTGKSSWATQVMRGALLGAYACEDCASNHDVSCPSCGGRAWCPTPSKVVMVAIARHQAVSALGEMVAEMVATIPEELIVTKSEDKDLVYYLKLVNGSTFEIKTSKSREGAMQGFGANLVILDEHCPRPVYREVSMRKKAERVLKLIIDYTPTEGRTWIDEELLDACPPGVRVVRGAIWENGEEPCGTCGKNAAQWDASLLAQGWARSARWHRQLKGLCVRCHTFGTEPRFDQRWLEEQEAEMDDRELAIRFYGEAVTLEGNAFFSPPEQAALRRQVAEPVFKQGGHRRWVPPCVPGPYPTFVPGRDYVVGVDGSEGRGGDEAVICGLDAHTGAVCSLWTDFHTPPEVYTEDVRLLALEMQARSVCVEHEKSGAIVNNLLRAQMGVRLYRHRSVDKRFVKSSGLPGFRPSGPTTYRVLRQVVRAIRKTLREQPDGSFVVEPGIPGGLYLYDREQIEQTCRLYVDDNGKIQTTTKHDDRVMALAMAWEAVEALGGQRQRSSRDVVATGIQTEDDMERFWRQRAAGMPDYNPGQWARRGWL